MVRTHQPGEAVFRSVLPEDMNESRFRRFRRQSASLSWSVSPQSPAPT